jgi:xylulokinase
MSGHSLVTVPVDKDLNVLMDTVPIWSDSRASAESKRFFESVDPREWYMTTGNGFPAPLYSIFKIMWLKKRRPDIYERTCKFLGSKDYINFRLTGEIATDFSYASGIGAYDLKKRALNADYLAAAGIRPDFFPDIAPSHQIIGHVTRAASLETGLAEGTAVVCGGVDNSCMALGALGPAEGRVYVSLGSSSWIPANSREPILDPVKKPYVFAHIEEGMFTSAFSIFSGGNSLRWIRENLCKDITDDDAAYRIMDELADKVPVGANGVIFNPSLAGGTSQDKSVNIHGAFLGLHLGASRDDMIRAAMEGIAMNLKLSLDSLKEHARLDDVLLVCGGGSKSGIWLQMFADIFGIDILKSSIDQDAASVGAAAIAMSGIGAWSGYEKIESLHKNQELYRTDWEKHERYAVLRDIFAHTASVLADIGDYLSERL